MALDPIFQQALDSATRAAAGSSTLPSRTDRLLVPADLGQSNPQGASIPPHLRQTVTALLLVAQAAEAAGAPLSVQEGANPAITDINLLRFNGAGGATVAVTDIGDNSADITITAGLEPNQVLSPARVASTADVAGTYTADAGGPFKDQLSVAVVPTIDGYNTWAIGDRLLLKDQATASQNGVYEVIQTAGPWIVQRVSDYCGSQDPGKVVQILQGPTNGDLVFFQSSPDTDPVTVGGAAGDALTFEVYPANVSVSRLEETVGATGTYATLDAAITAFNSGTWGDGVTFRVLFVDNTAQSTDWSGLPGTTRCVILRTCVDPGPTVTVTAPFLGDMVLAGALTVDVDTTHLIEENVGPGNLQVRDRAEITSSTQQGLFDLVRSSSQPDLLIESGARVLQFRFFSATLAGAASTSQLYLNDATAVSDQTTVGTGTGAGSLNLTALGGTLGGHQLDLNGDAFGTGINVEDIDNTGFLNIAGNYVSCAINLTRRAGGTLFTYDLQSATIIGCSFGGFDFGGAGLLAINASGATIIDTGLRGTLGTGVMSTGAFSVASMVRCQFLGGIENATITATETIEDLDLNTVTGSLDINGPRIRGITFNPTGNGFTYDVGDAGSTTLERFDVDFSNATSYTLTLLGQVIRDTVITDPEDDAGGTLHVLGDIPAAGPGADLIENVRINGDRGGSVAVDIAAMNMLGIDGRQFAVGDSRIDLNLFGKHIQKVVCSGDLDVTLEDVFYDGLTSTQHGVLDSVEVNDGTVTVATAFNTNIQQISNCRFNGGTTTLDGNAGSDDLHLSNTQFTGAGAPTIANFNRAVVASSISNVAVVVGATSKAIGTSNIGIS